MTPSLASGQSEFLAGVSICVTVHAVYSFIHTEQENTKTHLLAGKGKHS